MVYRLVVFQCLMVVCWFFFFKQKTAYEMRISDWSSDVCSSDLLKWTSYSVAYSVSMSERVKNSGAPCGPSVTASSQHVCIAGTCSAGTAPATPEIGRASCRERVGQYV